MEIEFSAFLRFSALTVCSAEGTEMGEAPAGYHWHGSDGELPGSGTSDLGNSS